MAELVGPSGAKIVINPAPWKDAKGLKNAIQKAAATTELKISMDDVGGLLRTFLQTDSAPEVDAALAPCLARCTRNGEKITDATFEEVDARQDYYEIVFACVKENLGPLVDSLIAKLPFARGMSNVAPLKSV